MIPFVERDPIWQEVEKIRLILSTFQDGTGQLVNKQDPRKTLPGWRDFERAVALALDGQATESKYIFDILLPGGTHTGKHYGLSCKMRGELNRVDRDGRVTIEVANSAKKFWLRLNSKSINQTNYRAQPRESGIGVIEEVESWHTAASDTHGGSVDISCSSYLVLSWNNEGWYQLHQFALTFSDPATLTWYCPLKLVDGKQELSQRINGDDERGTLFEWYGTSGGQLKYYPLAEDAIWSSVRFRLEPILDQVEHGILRKAREFFPELWTRCAK